MKREMIKTVAIGVAAALLIGLFMASTGLLPFLMMATGMAGFVLYLAVSTDRETKRDTKKYPGMIFFFLLLCLVLSIGITILQDDRQREEADQVVERLELYKRANGCYPRSLDSLRIKPRSIAVQYQADPAGSYYRLEYGMGGLAVSFYDSRTKEWTFDD